MPPIPYDPAFSFTGYQTANPADPLPGPNVDNELFNLQTTTDSLIASLAQIQRSDGALKNGIVTTESLAVELIGGLKPPTAWATGVVYAVSATVFFGPKLYICAVAHTSGVFATDLAAGKWVQLADFTPTGVTPASSVSFIPGASGLVSTDAQSAILEVFSGFSLLKTLAYVSSVATANLNDAAVTTAKIADAAVTLAKIVNGDALSVIGRDGNTAGVLGSIAAATDGHVLRRSGSTIGFGQIATVGIADAAVTPAKQASQGGIGGLATNLVMTVTSNSAVSVTADALVLADVNGNTKIASAVSVSVDLASGGLDTGTEASSTWYHLHLFSNGSTVVGRLSLSSTAPSYPTGYNYRAYIGPVRNDASSNLWRSIQRGSDAQLVLGTNPTATPVMASGFQGSVTTPTFVAVAIGNFIPPTAGVGRFSTYKGNNQQIILAPNPNYSSVGAASAIPYLTQDSTNEHADNRAASVSMVLESSNVYWAASGSACVLGLQGWKVNR